MVLDKQRYGWAKICSLKNLPLVRMSSIIDLGSIAVNKLRYNLFKAAYDPEAEKYVKQEKVDNTTTVKDTKPKEGYKDAIPSRWSALSKSAKGVLNTLRKPFKKEEENTDNVAQSDEEKKDDADNIAQSDQVDTLPKVPTLPNDPAASFTASFMSTFFSLLGVVLLFFICTTAGSIAANDAIGRAVAVRLVYFIYGSIPLFSPFVLIYYAIRYFFLKTYPVWYNYLPVTSHNSSYGIVNILLKPFFYLPDANTKYMHQKFVEASEPFVWGGVPARTNKGTEEVVEQETIVTSETRTNSKVVKAPSSGNMTVIGNVPATATDNKINKKENKNYGESMRNMFGSNDDSFVNPESPKTELPKADPPKTESPKAELPTLAEPPKPVEPSKPVESSKAESPKAEPPKAELPKKAEPPKSPKVVKK